ncbi:MAG TPA: ABC transporter substrate-binding protein [Oscillospiraceae bacterium]|jgi:ABC-type glycerol-3-phosphate transport system substrate-binding protein|nr:sugar transporter substrate-binding protein [Oscillospiraceae bacterium]MDN5378317.1 raffinose/stachyose/melibiose transport system substrate-binding protein [Clostridiales bacterium]HOV40703.1 ABC transporter substrate-binding protein [Oscillospiraceae bacterium]
MKAKKVLSAVLALATLVSMSACGTSKSSGTSGADSGSSAVPNIYDIKLGEDYKDIKADLTFLTHRTDIADTVFADYIKKFNELYPNIKITYDALTDYAEEATVRLTTDDWGDIMMIPTTVQKNELPNLFVSFGKLDDLNKVYNFNNNFAYKGNVYGIASVGNAQGIVYNKKVFEAAGVTSLPKTPDEFLDALQKIKDKTDAIPMYSNYAAGWTMGAWDAYIGGSATGDADFMNVKLPHMKNPFSKKDDMTGPYAVYYVLYEATKRGLIEDDPTTTDWEGSKGMINRGEIGCMVLGSWAIVQMQQAGDNAADIAYMPFPISVGGKQYASAGPDYCYGINKKVSTDEQIAAMLYIKWLTEKSNFAYDQGGIPIDKTQKYPDTLKAFDGIELVVDTPAPEGEETLFNDLNTASELGINSSNDKKSEILEAAMNGTKTLDQIMDEWNQKWTAAQEKYKVEIKY